MTQEKEKCKDLFASISKYVDECPQNLCPTIICMGKIPSEDGGVHSINAVIGNETTILLALFDMLIKHPEIAKLMIKAVKHLDEFKAKFGDLIND